MKLTLNGIAQGFASDRVLATLRGHGIEHALINIGEHAPLGESAAGDPWTVGIQHPRHEDAYVALADLDGRSRIVQVAKKGRGWTLTTRGAAHQVQVMPRHVAELAKHMIEKVPPDMSRFLLAPMPGLLTRLEVQAGDTVEAGQPLAVVEAMKMENILRAEKSATVKATAAKAGDSLAVDQVIVEFE